jgi:hypothetical protein
MTYGAQATDWEPYYPEVLDSSMIAVMKQCPQLWKKVYIDEWKSKVTRIDLHAGAAFAKGVEDGRRAFFEDGKEAEEAQAIGVASLLRYYGNVECPPENPKSAERMAGALTYYFDQFPLTHSTGYPILLPGGKRAIELSFAQPLAINHPITGQPLIYAGRLDAVLSTLGDQFGCDEKTTKSLGPTWPNQWQLRAQLIGYKWGMKQWGIRVAGVVVRGVSILKTKYDHAESVNYYPDWMVDRWEMELLEWIEESIRWWKTKRYRYNMDFSCSAYGGCGFLDTCTSQNEQPWLETYYERRHWDPVTRTETLLNPVPRPLGWGEHQQSKVMAEQLK